MTRCKKRFKYYCTAAFLLFCMPAYTQELDIELATNLSRDLSNDLSGVSDDNTAEVVLFESCAQKKSPGQRLQCFDKYNRQQMLCYGKKSSQERLDCFDRFAAKENGIIHSEEESKLSAVDQRLSQEMLGAEIDSEWLILPYKPTYILPITYNAAGTNTDPWTQPGIGNPIDPNDVEDIEAKFQFSFKVPLWENIGGSNTRLYFGFTQLSAWQIYSSDISEPFRESNYQPEFLLSHRPDYKLGPLNLDVMSVSFNHESNGRNEPISRSWNRIIFNFVMSYNNWAFQLKPWYRIPESDTADNNPDIEDFTGHGEYWAYYKHGKQTFSTMLMSSFGSNSKTTIQLDWSFPIYGKLKGYVQYYNGYKETLIDYNYKNERIGVGLMLTNVI